MYRFAALLLMLSGILSLSACVSALVEKPAYRAEVFEFSGTSRGKEKPVIAMIATPPGSKDKLPLIITLHGSNRDGVNFPGGNGRSDEYSSRLMREGARRGFAVVALDAFYKTDIQPSEKTTFPNAHQYALDLRDILAKDRRFDTKNFFLTGFSYGGGTVRKSVDSRTDFKSMPWRAVASAEPGCNVISEPVKVPFPLLIIKGSESHYYLEPCQYFERLLRAAEVNVTLVVIEGANHFFSTNGQIKSVGGAALNGCRYNPVIRKKGQVSGGKPWFEFADGSPTTLQLIRQKCFTNMGGAGKNGLLHDGVI